MTSDVQGMNGRSGVSTLADGADIAGVALDDDDFPGPPPRFLRERAPRGDAAGAEDTIPFISRIRRAVGAMRDRFPDWGAALRLTRAGRMRRAP